MSKCPQCRKNDRELLTVWERFRDWLFHWFKEDIADLTQAKYTQGFSDGWAKGIESARLDAKKWQEFASPAAPTEEQLTQRFNDLLSPVDMTKVVALDKGKGIVYIGGELVDQGRLSNLKAEADFLVQSDLWSILYETPKELVQREMFVSGDSLDTLKKGRSVLYALSCQKNIVEVFKGYQKK